MKSLSHVQRRLKYVATINDEALTEDTDSDFEIQYVDIGNVDSSGTIHEIARYRFEDAPSRARRIVRDGDVIISTVRTYLQAIAPIQHPPENLIVSTGFAIIRPRIGVFDPGFCRYALREPLFLAEVEMRSTGVSYPAINASDLGDICVYVPSLQKQRAIADYLDRETAQIDALAAAKAWLLALLAEKRRALITRAVTRGLDPHAPLRASGVPWLGDVPEHWEVLPLKRIVETPVTDGPHETPDFVDSGIPFVSVEAVWDGRVHFESMRGFITREAHERYSRKYRPCIGDVYVVKSGATTGKVAIVDFEDEFNVWSPLAAVRCSSTHAQSWFVFYALSSDYFQEQIRVSWSQGTQPNIAMDVIENLYVTLPPILEQSAIVAHLAAETARLDALAAAAARSLALLKERRAALIAAAVTGRVDVPGLI